MTTIKQKTQKIFSAKGNINKFSYNSALYTATSFLSMKESGQNIKTSDELEGFNDQEKIDILKLRQRNSHLKRTYKQKSCKSDTKNRVNSNAHPARMKIFEK